MHGELCSKVFSSGSKHAGFIGRNLMQIWNMSSFPRTADFRAEPRNLGFYDPSRAAESATEFAFLQRNSSFFPRNFVFSADFDVFHSNNSENDLDAHG